MNWEKIEHKTEGIKWAAIPVLVVGSMFSYFARSYEPLIDIAVCVCAVILMLRAVWRDQFFWAAGLSSIVVVFSPLFLVIKLFLLMAITCAAACAVLFGAMRRRPVEAL